jgi:hypothetical protein
LGFSRTCDVAYTKKMPKGLLHKLASLAIVKAKPLKPSPSCSRTVDGSIFPFDLTLA